MSKRFFIKSGQCNSHGHPVWVEITGQEFYHLVNSPEGANRFFLNMKDEDDTELDEYFLECTEKELRSYKAEKNNRYYLRMQEEGWSKFSIYDNTLFEDGSGEELLSDGAQNVEEEALKRLASSNLQSIIQSLPEEEQAILRLFYYATPIKSIRQISAETGIPVMTLNNRKKKLLCKLNKLLSSRKNFGTNQEKVSNRK